MIRLEEVGCKKNNIFSLSLSLYIYIYIYIYIPHGAGGEMTILLMSFESITEHRSKLFKCNNSNEGSLADSVILDPQCRATIKRQLKSKKWINKQKDQGPDILSCCL